LGIKIVEKKRSRTRSRSRTPKLKLMSTTATRSTVVQKKRSVSPLKSKKRSGRDLKSSRDERWVKRRERDKDDKAGRSYDRMRDTKRNQDSKHGVRGSRRSSSEERSRYDRYRRLRNQSREREAPLSQSKDFFTSGTCNFKSIKLFLFLLSFVFLIIVPAQNYISIFDIPLAFENPDELFEAIRKTEEVEKTEKDKKVKEKREKEKQVKLWSALKKLIPMSCEDLYKFPAPKF
jgi:hypothetical protein